jgi:hypothetical protein
VQGWIVSDPDVLANLDVADDETLVEMYSRRLAHLEKDELSGEVVRDRHPIVSRHGAWNTHPAGQAVG